MGNFPSPSAPPFFWTRYTYTHLHVGLFILLLKFTPTTHIPRLHDDGAVRNGSAWHGTEQLSSNVYTRFWLCGIEWFFKSNSVVSLPEIKMDALFTTFRAIEKRRHQMHKRRAIIFSRFSRNIHNIMAMAIQYTSNGLSTDLVVHQLIFFTAFQLHLYRFLSPNLYQPFVSSNPPF